jgi:hypothetical protein
MFFIQILIKRKLTLYIWSPCGSHLKASKNNTMLTLSKKKKRNNTKLQYEKIREIKENK